MLQVVLVADPDIWLRGPRQSRHSATGSQFSMFSSTSLLLFR